MRTLRTEPYFTPHGAVDVPYAYVFDGTSLTDGNDLFNAQQVTAGDSSFILRRIVGLPTVLDTGANGGKFNYKNASQSYVFMAQVVPPNVITVVPEKLYPPNGSIFFDLYKILRDSTACGGTPIPTAQIAFFGVRRYQLGRGYAVRETPYKYYEKRYSFEYSLTLNVASGTPPQRQIIPMDAFDFELLEIMISDAGDTTGVGALQTADFSVQLYDANMHQLSSAPLLQGFINSGRVSTGGSGTGKGNGAPPYQAVMPCPSIVYPAGGNIVFDITSLLCATSLPKTYNISFLGIWRKPC